MKRILVAYNNRARTSEYALELAKIHAKAFNATLEVVTSADPSKSEKDIPQKLEAEKALADVQNRLAQEGLACNTHLLIRGMSPGEDIVQFAQEKAIDEIIVGVERKSRVGKFVMGSMAQYIILKAPCPVVTVKIPDTETDVYLGSTSMEE